MVVVRALMVVVGTLAVLLVVVFTPSKTMAVVPLVAVVVGAAVLLVADVKRGIPTPVVVVISAEVTQITHERMYVATEKR